MNYKDQRVGVFIDIQNLYHSAKHLYNNSRVNFGEVLKAAVGERSLIRAIGYVVKSDTALGEDAFFDALAKSGIELRMKDLQIFAGGAKKADWDVGIAVDAIRMSQHLDVVVLVTGDGDFVPLVEYLQQGMGRQVEVVSFARSTSSKLQEVTDHYLDLGSSKSFLLSSSGRGKKRSTKKKTNS